MTTDLEALMAAGLTLEEAELILRRRAPRGPVSERLARAAAALEQAQAKTGVPPVRLTADGILEKSEFQDLEAVERFYENKEVSKSTHPRFSPTKPLEDQSQDPEDY